MSEDPKVKMTLGDEEIKGEGSFKVRVDPLRAIIIRVRGVSVEEKMSEEKWEHLKKDIDSKNYHATVDGETGVFLISEETFRWADRRMKVSEEVLNLAVAFARKYDGPGRTKESRALLAKVRDIDPNRST